jgi:glucosamine-6-phosphate deaminase
MAGATVMVVGDSATGARIAADKIAAKIVKAVAGRGKAVLGLATGKTPITVYQRLVALHKAGELSFTGVSTYNLDEYYPIQPFDPNSYRSYMYEHLFRHVDLAPNRAHVLDGTVPAEFVAEHAASFDRWMAAEGGLDLQLLGLGRNGHIGFNEPSDLPLDEALTLPTRLVELHPVTRADAVADFGDEAAVIPRALTVGTGPILAARSIFVLAFGANKAEAVAKSLSGPMSARVPGSLLQHAAGRVVWIIDEAAAQDLG